MLDGRNPSAWNQVRFLPRGWQWVDPLKDINSNIAAVDNGLTSRSRIVGETGGDFEEIAEELADEQRLIDELKLNITGVGESGKPTAADIPEDAEGEDEQNQQGQTK